MATDSFPIDSPPQELLPASGQNLSLRARERSAVLEAITAVCEAQVGERGTKLMELIDEIKEKNGPKAAFDSFIKLLEFAQPKLQRITVQDPDGNAPTAPVINVSFAPIAQPQQPVTIVLPSEEASE